MRTTRARSGHGVTLDAGLAKAVTSRVLSGSTVIDLDSVPGAPATLETRWLSPDRFAEGRQPDFDLTRPTPADELVRSGEPPP